MSEICQHFSMILKGSYKTRGIVILTPSFSITFFLKQILFLVFYLIVLLCFKQHKQKGFFVANEYFFHYSGYDCCEKESLVLFITSSEERVSCILLFQNWPTDHSICSWRFVRQKMNSQGCIFECWSLFTYYRILLQNLIS